MPSVKLPANTILTGSVILGITILAGRFSGFFREIQVASVFGVTKQADIAILLLTLPDMLVGILLSGGLSAALIPEFRKVSASEKALLFRQATRIIVLVFALIGMTFIVAGPLWIRILAPGYANTLSVEIAPLFTIVAFAIPLTAMTGVTSAMLHSQNRFLMAGIGTLIYNICIILFILQNRWSDIDPLLLIAAGIVTGAAIRWLSQRVAVRGWLVYKEASGNLLGKRLMRNFLFALSASSLVLLTAVIMRACASLIGEGYIAAVNFSTKLVELPIGIAITAISTAALPALSQFAIQKKRKHLYISYYRHARLALLISMVICMMSIWYADALVDMIYGYGKTTSQQLDRIIHITRIILLTLPLVAISSMAAALLNATGNTDKLLRVTTLSFVVLLLALIPGVLQRDITLLVLALPVFHVFLSILTYVSAQRVFSFSAKRRMPKRQHAITLVMLLIYIVCVFFIDSKVDLPSSFYRLFMAFVLMLPVAYFSFVKYKQSKGVT